MLQFKHASRTPIFRKLFEAQCSFSLPYCDACGGNQGKPPPCPQSPTIYECRKFGHKLPGDTVKPCFETLKGIPTGVFRCTDGEVLGRGAYKGSCYQNPEYFSFHHMTFYDFHLHLRPCRKPSPKTGRKL